MAAALRLRPLRIGDEASFVAAHEAMAADGFAFGLFYEPGMEWAAYLAQLERQRRGIDLPADHVPATFLVADLGGEIVGRSSLRHELNDFLRREGGHIGYGVLAPHRRRGHATEVLRQSLIIIRSIGLGRVLVTCDDGNIGSATVIERCGGVFDSLVECADGPAKRRYWID